MFALLGPMLSWMLALPAYVSEYGDCYGSCAWPAVSQLAPTACDDEDAPCEAAWMLLRYDDGAFSQGYALQRADAEGRSLRHAQRVGLPDGRTVWVDVMRVAPSGRVLLVGWVSPDERVVGWREVDGTLSMAPPWGVRADLPWGSTAAHLAADGSILIVDQSGPDQVTRLDGETGEHLWTVELAPDDGIRHFANTEDGGVIVSGDPGYLVDAPIWWSTLSLEDGALGPLRLASDETNGLYGSPLAQLGDRVGMLDRSGLLLRWTDGVLEPTVDLGLTFSHVAAAEDGTFRGAAADPGDDTVHVCVVDLEGRSRCDTLHPRDSVVGVEAVAAAPDGATLVAVETSTPRGRQRSRVAWFRLE